MTILITGATGRIGRHLVTQLLDEVHAACPRVEPERLEAVTRLSPHRRGDGVIGHAHGGGQVRHGVARQLARRPGGAVGAHGAGDQRRRLGLEVAARHGARG